MTITSNSGLNAGTLVYANFHLRSQKTMYRNIFLWSPYEIGQTIKFSSCGSFFFFLA